VWRNNNMPSDRVWRNRWTTQVCRREARDQELDARSVRKAAGVGIEVTYGRSKAAVAEGMYRPDRSNLSFQSAKFPTTGFASIPQNLVF
jgi:hypothetical protein